VYERLRLACERFLRRTPGWLGDVPDDAALGSRVRTPGALLDDRTPVFADLASRLDTLLHAPDAAPAGAAARASA
jgi:hypothetical protein